MFRAGVHHAVVLRICNFKEGKSDDDPAVAKELDTAMLKTVQAWVAGGKQLETICPRCKKEIYNIYRQRASGVVSGAYSENVSLLSVDTIFRAANERVAAHQGTAEGLLEASAPGGRWDTMAHARVSCSNFEAVPKFQQAVCLSFLRRIEEWPKDLPEELSVDEVWQLTQRTWPQFLARCVGPHRCVCLLSLIFPHRERAIFFTPTLHS